MPGRPPHEQPELVDGHLGLAQVERPADGDRALLLRQVERPVLVVDLWPFQEPRDQLVGAPHPERPGRDQHEPELQPADRVHPLDGQPQVVGPLSLIARRVHERHLGDRGRVASRLRAVGRSSGV